MIWKVVLCVSALLLISAVFIHGSIRTLTHFLVTYTLDSIEISVGDTGHYLEGAHVTLGNLPGIIVWHEGTRNDAFMNPHTYALAQRSKPVTRFTEDGISITVDPTPVMVGDIFTSPYDDSANKMHTPHSKTIFVDYIWWNDPISRKMGVKIF